MIRANLCRRLLLCLLLVGFVGCNWATAVLPDEKRLVILWHSFTGEEADALMAMTDRFNRESVAGVVLVPEYHTGIGDKLQRAAPEQYPDLIVVWPKDMIALREADRITAVLDPVFGQEEDREDLLPMAAMLYSSEQGMQALPLGLATYLLYYNANWMVDLGYTPEQALWEDLRRTACSASDPVAGRIGLGMPARASTLLAFLTAGGARIVDQQGLFGFYDPGGVNTALGLHALLSGGCGLVYEDWDVGVLRLSRGSMAMIVESSERFAEIQEAVVAGRNFTLGVSALPGSTGPGSTLWYGPGIVVTASSAEQQQAALDVLRWFYSLEAQTLWSSITGYLPVRRSLIAQRLSAEPLISRQQMLASVLDAAERASWVAWPEYADRMACRASLLRGLLSLSRPDAQPAAYISTAATVCNTGLPLPSSAEQ